MSYDPEANRKAESNEFYSRTKMGRVLCKLCDVLCRDATNFNVHLTATKHVTALARRQRNARLAKLQDDQGTSGGGMGGKRPREEGHGGGGDKGENSLFAADIDDGKAAIHGRPVHSVRVEPNPAVQVCKVWVEVQYPGVDGEVDRPPIAYRWLSSYEQTVEAPQPGIVYLLVACDGYETIALKFPSGVPRDSTKEKVQWDPKNKTYSLYFTLG